MSSLLTLLFFVAAFANVSSMFFLSGSQMSILFHSYYGSFLGVPSGVILGTDRYTLAALSPNVFSPEGCVTVILWGLAYAAVAKQFQRVPWICFVFFLEKLFYTLTWLNWRYANAARWSDISAAADPMSTMFFQYYGLVDLFFAVVFLLAFLKGFFAADRKYKEE